MLKEVKVEDVASPQIQQTGSDDSRPANWSCQDLVDGLSFTAINFEPFVPEINALNVFPVPDGDTGTNMFLTLQASARAARQFQESEHGTIADVLRAAAHGALMGARGNSGVILYQILEGLAETAPTTSEIDGSELIVGLRRAAELAYQAVINPVEGTMLTVIRAAADAAEYAVDPPLAVQDVLRRALDGASDALEQTPDQLPILRQAGVVDAGGRGLVVILDGLMRFCHGDKPTQSPVGEVQDVASAMTFLDQVDLVHGVDEFGYCTNFIVVGDALEIDRIRDKMNELGKSAVVVGTDRALKVHVHSEHPGEILESALVFGELEEVRIDNMAAQTRKLLADRSIHGLAVAEHAPPIAISIVAVASGEGLARALTGMGATLIVQGGRTTNPSTQEILAKVERAPSEFVIILPNDSNIIAAANHVANLSTKTVQVVPSRSVPQGISALSAFNLREDVDENVSSMTDALDLVRTVSVTRASRDAHIDGVMARQGEYIGLLEGRMVTAGTDFVDVGIAALERSNANMAELLTVFTGESAEAELVDSFFKQIEAAYPHLTVEMVEGGQPHYDLIIAVE